MPMVAEEIWRGLTGGRSVHLTDWPAVVAPVEPALTDVIDGVRQAVSTTLGLRKAHQIRVRQPLRTLTVAVGDPEGAREAATGLRSVAPDHPLVRQVLGDSAAAAGSRR